MGFVWDSSYWRLTRLPIQNLYKRDPFLGAASGTVPYQEARRGVRRLQRRRQCMFVRLTESRSRSLLLLVATLFFVGTAASLGACALPWHGAPAGNGAYTGTRRQSAPSVTSPGLGGRDASCAEGGGLRSIVEAA